MVGARATSSQPNVEPGRFNTRGVGFEGWEVDASVVAVLFDSFGEAAVLPVVAVDAAQCVDDLGESGDVDLVAFGEPPPRVEGVEAFLEAGDAVDRGVPVEDLEDVVAATGLTQFTHLLPRLVVAVDVGAGRGLDLFETVPGPGDVVVGGGELAAGVAAATEPAALEPVLGNVTPADDVVDVTLCLGEPFALGTGGLIELVHFALGGDQLGVDPLPRRGVVRRPLLGLI
jgi:hypothetical protein